MMPPNRYQLAWLVKGVLLALPLFFQGCGTMYALKSEPGKDISSIKPGITREEVEASMGKSEREWTTSADVRYRIYTYDAGVPPNKSQAFSNFLAEVATLGIVDIWAYSVSTPEQLSKRPQSEHVMREMAVSYNGQDQVIGVFPVVDNQTVLPADGHPLRK